MVKEIGSDLGTGDYDRDIGEIGFEANLGPEDALRARIAQKMPLEAPQILPRDITDTPEAERAERAQNIAGIMPEILESMPEQDYQAVPEQPAELQGMEKLDPHTITEIPPMSEIMVHEERPGMEEPLVRPITPPEYQELQAQVAQSAPGIQEDIPPIRLPEEFRPTQTETQRTTPKQRSRQATHRATQEENPMRPITLPGQRLSQESEQAHIKQADYIPPRTPVQSQAAPQDTPQTPAIGQDQLLQAIQKMMQNNGAGSPTGPGIPGLPGSPAGRGIQMYDDNFSLPDPRDDQAPDLDGTGPLDADDGIRIDIGRALDTYKSEISIEGTTKRDNLAIQLSDVMKRTVNQFLIEKHGEDEELAGVPKSYKIGGRTDAEEITKRVLRQIVDQRYGFSSDIVQAAQEDEGALYQIFNTLMEKRQYSDIFNHYVATAGRGSVGRIFEGTAKTLGQKVAGIRLKTAKEALIRDENSTPQIENIIDAALKEHGKELRPDVNAEDRVAILGTVFAEDGKLYPGQVAEYEYAVKDIERK